MCGSSEIDPYQLVTVILFIDNEWDAIITIVKDVISASLNK